MRITLIAAVSQDGFISRNGGVPWDLPEDRRQFRLHTQGKWLLLGRRTFQEMTGWFREGHRPLVLSRDPTWTPEPGRRVENVETAARVALEAGADELVVCGGGQVYAAAIPYATHLRITHVADVLRHGIAFPSIPPQSWAAFRCECHPASGGAPAFEVRDYVRRGVGPRV